MNTTILLVLILFILLVLIFSYTIVNNNNNDNINKNTKEGFYPRYWWDRGYHRPHWGWRRPWMNWWGNWRPYGYYPAYSGYWKQCEPNGTWCPQTMSCNSPACQ